MAVATNKDDFVKGNTPKKFGLTCGFWSDDPDAIDRHLLSNTLSHHKVYDLFKDQWTPEADTGCRLKKTGKTHNRYKGKK